MISTLICMHELKKDFFAHDKSSAIKCKLPWENKLCSYKAVNISRYSINVIATPYIGKPFIRFWVLPKFQCIHNTKDSTRSHNKMQHIFMNFVLFICQHIRISKRMRCICNLNLYHFLSFSSVYLRYLVAVYSPKSISKNKTSLRLSH